LYDFGYGPLSNAIMGPLGLAFIATMELRKKLLETWDRFKERIAEVKERIVALWDKFKEKVSEIRTKIVELWDRFKERVGEIKTKIIELWDRFKERIAEIKTKWNELWAAVGEKLGVLKTKWGEFWAGVGAGVGSIKTIFKEISDGILGLPAKIAKMFNVNLPDWYYVLTGQQRPRNYAYSTQNSTNAMQMRQFAAGTDYVPYTGPAIIHQGEQITPASQNPYNGDSETNRLLRQLIAIETARRTTSVQIGSREVVKATFSDLINEAKRTNTPWPVPA
jgi:DNA-directed RNA polymerase subunit N (RpoN/RPB10)